MTPKFYELLERCIEDGLELGWNRAHKHSDCPNKLTLCDEQRVAILGQIHEWFDFPEPPAT